MKRKTTATKEIILVFILIGLIILQSCKPKETTKNYSSEIITTWNQKVMKLAIAEDGLLTLKGVRTEALMHTAIHDALNAITPMYSTYSYNGIAENADPMATVAQAAYAVVVSQYPEKKKELEIELTTWLETVPEGTSKQEGIILGNEAAKKIITAREGDKFNGDAEYTWHPMAPDVYAEFNEHKWYT